MAKVKKLRFKREYSKIRTCPDCLSVLVRKYAKRGKRGQIPHRWWNCPVHKRIARPTVRTVT